MGNPLQKAVPTSPLKEAHLRMLKLAEAAPVLMVDPLDPSELVPLATLALKGAAARSVIKSLQARGLIDTLGDLTQAGRGAILRNAQLASEEG